jgi:hypothetical protein
MLPVEKTEQRDLTLQNWVVFAAYCPPQPFPHILSLSFSISFVPRLPAIKMLNNAPHR